MISLLHPSRQRPDRSIGATTKWLTRSGINDYELIVSLDLDDPTYNQYIEHYKSLSDPDRISVIGNDNKCAVEAINNAAKVAKGNILIVVSDDTDCPSNWGNIILQMIDSKEDFLLKVNDGVQPWICTMPIMDRKYYDRFGYIYYPGYQHMFCDTEITHVADILDKLIIRNDIVFNHLHYSVAKSKRDEVNEMADSTWNNGKRLYLDRFKSDFGLTGVNRWAIRNEQHINWLKNSIR